MKINFPFSYQLRLYFSRLEKREGVASIAYGTIDKHILLWDFDNTKLTVINKSLRYIQTWYKLSTIYIISSSPNRYHAYCFSTRTFKEVINILSATPEIDIKFLRLGMVRGYYTLRISPRKNDNFKIVSKLKSTIIPNIDPLAVSISSYMTINKGGHNG